MTKFLPIAALAIAVIAGGGWFLGQGGSTGSGQGLLPGAAQAQEATEADASAVVEMVQGDPDAAVEVIEYASFTCPHCATFHADQYQQLLENYIEPGKIRFVYREIYFDRPGLWASMLARCGGEMRFFGISEMLYEQQREWLAGGQDPALIVENLRRIGLTAGMSGEEIDACMSDGETAANLVAWFEANAEADAIRSTPSFVIDGELFSNMNYTDFAAILDEKLGE